MGKKARAEGEEMTIINVIKILATASAALCWFMSARVAITPIAPGMEGLDKVTLLADDLQKMGMWNLYAAASACIAAVTEVIAILYSR
jgi:hypothetical protein